MNLRRALRGGLLLLLALVSRPASAQERGAAALDQLLRGLPVTARVLMIGAHPDDEDTQLLAWLTRGHQVRTAYLSLTRGDGGQNLIGSALGEALGAIRTEELLAARRVDGAEQYFSRAYDFGFSKSAEETFTQWDREELTGDVVRVIRAFRPHVVVAVFSGTPADGHGHHQASGLLARAAFEAAGDMQRFPERTHGRGWAPGKFYRGAWARNAPATLSFEAGQLDPVIGRTPAEIAAESRSQHRSQGFGVLENRGRVAGRLTRELSNVPAPTPATDERSLFDGLDTTFARHLAVSSAASAPLGSALRLMDSLRLAAELRTPAKLVPALARLVALVDSARVAAPRCSIVPVQSYRQLTPPRAECSMVELDLDASLDLVRSRTHRALLEAAGVVIEATAQREMLAFGDSLPVRLRIYNRGALPLRVDGYSLVALGRMTTDSALVLAESSYTATQSVLGLVDHRPWWLGDRQKGMFQDTRSPADGVAMISYGPAAPLVPSVSVAEDARRLTRVTVRLTIAGVTTTLDAGEIIYRFADPVLGEQRRPVGGVPPITLTLDRALEYVVADRPIDRRVRVTLRSWGERERRLALRILVPKGVQVVGAPDSLVLAAGETRELWLNLRGQLPPGRHEFGVGASSEGTLYTEGFTTIEYPHIRPQRIFRSSALFLQSVRIVVPRTLTVAYVLGVSDAVSPALQQLGIPVTTVTAVELPLLDLARYTTVVIGPRAYEASAELRAITPRLLDWVRAGGTMVVQYGQFEMAAPGVMPYPIAHTRPAARVTDERAPVTVVDSSSRLLRWPNRITAEDWGEWVQERALYMPSTIDPRYRTPLAMRDPGEPEQRGAILEATLGKGRYIYTSLSLFRQLPGGVPGGARLLVNLLSAGLSPQ